MGMKWPATRNELYRAGYQREFEIPTRPCKRCNTSIEFWRTPEGKLMPLEPSPENKNEMLCHYATCPHADEFRKEKKIEKESMQPSLFDLPKANLPWTDEKKCPDS